MLHKAFRGNEDGFTLLEVIIAISILMVGLLAVATMQVSAIKGNAHANRIADATTYAQDQLENLMARPYTHADLDPGQHTGTNPPPGYAITWTVTENTSVGSSAQNTKLIKVTIAGDHLEKDIVFKCIKPNV
jgi:type IV pilus assembly protein PilV